MTSECEVCSVCFIKIKPKVIGNIHCKSKTWTCPKHGIFKSQFIIDGEVMREWKKKKQVLSGLSDLFE